MEIFTIWKVANSIGTAIICYNNNIKNHPLQDYSETLYNCTKRGSFHTDIRMEEQ